MISESRKTVMTELYLIVGLGNPGSRYENTRHNIGFLTVERLAQKYGLAFSKIEHRAQVANGTILGKRVILAKPQTFMNLSGDSVFPLARFYKIEPDHMIIVHDDLDLPLGTLRLRKGGSSGGQNGLKHILQRMGTQDIPRVRIGISRPPGRMDPVNYVLTPLKGDDEILAIEVQDRAIAAIETWLTDGIELAMSRHNGPSKTEKPVVAADQEKPSSP
jgi:PTH1 family peptidyl-tRNA hydrolase